MPLWLFIALFAFSSLFWAWVIFAGGADWLEGSFWFSPHPQWTADWIIWYAAICWFFEAIWFLIGLFDPRFRFSRYY